MSSRPATPHIFYKKPRRIRNTKPWESKCTRFELPEFNQAEKIIAKLGGPQAAAKLLEINPSSVYRWMNPSTNSGIIPSAAAAKIRRVARREGILLTKDDWHPELNAKITDQEEA